MEKQEQIGKAVLDTTYYPGSDKYNDGDQYENKLLQIVSTCSEMQYPEEIKKDGSWPILYHLSPIRENILNWYPFEAGAKVLELGSGCGAVTGALLGKHLQVTCVDLSLRRSRINATRHRDEKLTILVAPNETILPMQKGVYDYVTLIGVLEYAAVFSDVEKPFHYLLQSICGVLKENGILLVAIENKLGLKYFAGAREDHTARLFDGIENYPGKPGPYTFSRKELMDLADECGFDSTFYYPYPDYKFPQSVYSDDCLPRPGELDRNWQISCGNRITLFDEDKAFDTIIEAGLFPQMSNSFLVEMRKRESR